MELKEFLPIHQRIEKMLKQKRHCFFRVKPDMGKQQMVLNAENNLWKINYSESPGLVSRLQDFSSRFLEPLLGHPDSKYYEHYLKLINDIKNLNSI